MATSASRANPARVFIDSSVLIAAAISATGSARDLLNLGLAGTIQLIVSTFVLMEGQRNIARKVPRALPVFALIRTSLERRVVDPSPQLIATVAQTIAAKDAPIVAAALTAQADYLATYDRKHLLGQAAQIQATFKLTVTTPDQIISQL
jgi:predicted nucleic acid-binding protein